MRAFFSVALTFSCFLSAQTISEERATELSRAFPNASSALFQPLTPESLTGEWGQIDEWTFVDTVNQHWFQEDENATLAIEENGTSYKSHYIKYFQEYLSQENLGSGNLNNGFFLYILDTKMNYLNIDGDVQSTAEITKIHTLETCKHTQSEKYLLCTSGVLFSLYKKLPSSSPGA